MGFHIGSFIAGLIVTCLLHFALAAKYVEPIAPDDYHYYSIEEQWQIQNDVDQLDSFIQYMEASPNKVTELRRQLHNRDHDLKLKQTPPSERDYYWSRRGWVQRMTCQDSPEFAKPVASRPTSGYGRRRSPFSGRVHVHAGIDFRGQVGRPIQAAESGIVSWSDRKGRYGKTVVITHKNGFTTLYGHLSDYAVELGDRVIKGQTIGFIGRTGRVTGPHLHFEVRCYNVPVNPVAYLNKRGKKALVSVLRRRVPAHMKQRFLGHNQYSHSHRHHNHYSGRKHYSGHTQNVVIKKYVSSRQKMVNNQKQAGTASLNELRSRAF